MNILMRTDKGEEHSATFLYIKNGYLYEIRSASKNFKRYSTRYRYYRKKLPININLQKDVL